MNWYWLRCTHYHSDYHAWFRSKGLPAFDLARGVWTKPSHQTKQKRTGHVLLSGQALAPLGAILEASDAESPFLFPGNVPGRPLKGIETFRRSGPPRCVRPYVRCD